MPPFEDEVRRLERRLEQGNDDGEAARRLAVLYARIDRQFEGRPLGHWIREASALKKESDRRRIAATLQTLTRLGPIAHQALPELLAALLEQKREHCPALTRAIAAIALREQASEVRALLPKFREKQRLKSALALLAAIRDPASIADMIALLEELGPREVRLRRSTIDALGAIASPKAIPFLEAAYARDPVCAQHALRALALIKGPRSALAIAAALTHPSDDIRAHATLLLKPRLEELARTLTGEADPQEKLHAALGAARLGDPRGDALLLEGFAKALRKKHKAAFAIAEALGLRRATPAAPALLEALAAQEPAVRKHAARALGALQTGAEELRRRALEDPDREVRFAAVLALGDFQEARADAAVLEALSDTDSLVVSAAALVLGQRGPELIPALGRALARAPAGSRLPIAQALVAIGDPEALPAILRAMHAARPGEQAELQNAADRLLETALP